MDDTPAGNFAWECLAGAHPNAAAELDWSRFVAWVRSHATNKDELAMATEERIREALVANPDTWEVEA